MQCRRCQAEVPTDAAFCPECGAKLAVVCVQCKTDNAPSHKFCKKCGHLLAATSAEPAETTKFSSPKFYTPKHLAEKILISKTAFEGERKQVTILFADMKGSMELLADRDPEQARKLLDQVTEHMMEAVHRYEGTVSNVMGDGIMALFGAPLAHEDHAVRACYAALRMQESIKRYAEQVQRTEGVPIQIRVGLNSGDVVVGSIGSDLKMDYTAIGQSTHLAARMEQMAIPGSILIAGHSLRLVEGYVQTKALGLVTVKGLNEQVEVYEVTGAGPARSRLQTSAARGLTRFVGRDVELDTLRQALERARSGNGQVIALVGEPGVGKSRLFWEFIQSHRTQGWLVLKTNSVSYGKATAYFPIKDLLRTYFKIQDSDDYRNIREKISGKLLTLDESLRPTLPVFLTLLEVPVDEVGWQELDPPQKRHRTLDAVKRLLIRESQVQPLMLVFEDLHWIDSETQALLDNLVGALQTIPILLLVNYRSEYRHGWGSRASYTQLRLDPLPLESAEELLNGVLGTNPGLQTLKRLLVARTEGNPFFIEECIRTLVETKVLRGEHGDYNLAGAIENIQVPATVQAVLAARIDRLPVEAKHLLQSAAVIGENIPFTLLEAIAELPADDLHRGLAHLQEAEFLYETSLFPDLEYTFKHGLTCQVAYTGLLHERRNILHNAIVEAIERQFPDRVGEKVELLSHHSFKGEVWSKAATYLHQAGRKAALHSVNQQAVQCFEQALEALAHLPESRQTLEQAIAIRIDLGPVLRTTVKTSAPEVEQNYTQARELCQRLGETPQLFPALWGLCRVYHSRGEFHHAREVGEQLISLAQSLQDPSLMLEAHHTQWSTLFSLSEFLTMKEHIERGQALYVSERHHRLAHLYGGHDPGVCCFAHAARIQALLGYPDQALKLSGEALSLGKKLSHPFSLAFALFWAALVHQFRGDRDAVREHAEAGLLLGTEHGFPRWVSLGTLLRGWLCIEKGAVEQGIAQIQRGLAAETNRVEQQPFIALLAEAHGKAGKPKEGLRVVTQALAQTRKIDLRIYQAELHRVKGELLFQSGSQRLKSSAREAEICFQEAINISRRQEAKSLELRAVTSLSRLWRHQGKKEEARRMLAEIYSWFTEGFDTRDLQEANALLNELS